MQGPCLPSPLSFSERRRLTFRRNETPPDGQRYVFDITRLTSRGFECRERACDDSLYIIPGGGPNPRAIPATCINDAAKKNFFLTQTPAGLQSGTFRVLSLKDPATFRMKLDAELRAESGNLYVSVYIYTSPPSPRPTFPFEYSEVTQSRYQPRFRDAAWQRKQERTPGEAREMSRNRFRKDAR